MYLEAIIRAKRDLMAKGVSPDDMVIKLKRPVAEWLVRDKLANFQKDLPLLGCRAEVDENLRHDFRITLLPKAKKA